MNLPRFVRRNTSRSMGFDPVGWPITGVGNAPRTRVHMECSEVEGGNRQVLNE